jgi:hypothetical protein
MIKLRYCTLTVINISATIPCDSPPPHILSFLLLTTHQPSLHYPSPRIRRKRRKPFSLMRLLHNPRIPRGGGSPAFLRELCALRVRTNPLLHTDGSVQYPACPACIRFRINADPTVSNCRFQRAHARLKPFRCNVYKKPGAHPEEPSRHSSLTTSHFGVRRHTSVIFCHRA